MIPSWVFIKLHDIESRTVQWPFRHLHMHRQSIISHTMVTEIKNKLPCSTIDTCIGFQRDTQSKTESCLFSPPATHEPSPFLHRSLTSMCSSAWDAICSGKSIQVQHAMILYLMTSQVPHPAGETQCICVTADFGNLRSYHCFPVESHLRHGRFSGNTIKSLH